MRAYVVVVVYKQHWMKNKTLKTVLLLLLFFNVCELNLVCVVTVVNVNLTLEQISGALTNTLQQTTFFYILLMCLAPFSFLLIV